MSNYTSNIYNVAKAAYEEFKRGKEVVIFNSLTISLTEDTQPSETNFYLSSDTIEDAEYYRAINLIVRDIHIGIDQIVDKAEKYNALVQTIKKGHK
jgi:hypothetical protein